MLPNFRLLKTIRLVMLCSILFYALPAFSAPTTLSASDMLANIAEQLPSIVRLVTALAYVMGMFFVVKGLFKLKQYGEARTQMSSEHSLKGPIIFIVVGTLLIYFPGAIKYGMSTFWNNPNPYGYLDEEDQWSQLFSTAYLVLQIFGAIAFIRGLVMFTHLAGHGGQPGTMGRAMTHVIGGIFCINIYQLIQVIMVTLGIGSG